VEQVVVKLSAASPPAGCAKATVTATDEPLQEDSTLEMVGESGTP
jgi:hypothetical protein